MFRKKLVIQSALDFATTGLAANLEIATATTLTDPHHYIIATLGIANPQFRPLCSEIATFDTYGGRYTQRRIVCIGFSDHLVVKPSENPLNLATAFGLTV